jgi:hypothetical protein
MIRNEIKIKNKETGYQSGGFELPGFLDTMEDGTKLHLMNANIHANFQLQFLLPMLYDTLLTHTCTMLQKWGLWLKVYHVFSEDARNPWTTYFVL